MAQAEPPDGVRLKLSGSGRPPTSTAPAFLRSPGSVRSFLLEEMSLLGTPQAGAVFAVQARVVAQVLQLVKQGQITLPAAPAS